MKSRVGLVTLLLLYLFSAAVQGNDPDPLRWIAVYAAAAAACGLALAHLHRAARLLAMAIAAVALVWSLTLMPGVLAAPPSLADLFVPAMKTVAVEEAREALGLWIVAAGMAW